MRQINDAGLNLIKQFEGLSLLVYADVAGYPTVGYGHMSSGLKLGDTITLDQAEQLLKEDLEWVQDAVSSYVTVNITDNQFAALCSLVFNIGSHNFAHSTLLDLLNSGSKPDLVANQFLRWNRSGGNVVEGLTRRREAEKELYLT